MAQGAATSIEDAAVLPRCIKAHDGDDPEAAFKLYEAVRKHGPKVTGDQALALFKGMQWESPRGPVMIDPVVRDIIQNIYLRKVEKRNGKRLLLHL